MSRLTELIQELCPNGVEFKKIKEVYQRLKGTPITASKMKEIENPQGEIRIFAGGKTVINAKEIDIPNANITRVPAVLVQSRGVIDAVYYDKPFTFKNEMWAYTTENPVSVKFLYYVLKNNMEYFRSAAAGMGSLPQISLPVTEDFEIPLPPIEVQHEIVRILDTFTELTSELTENLSKELTARKQQYSYYRDKMLTFANGVKQMTIADICRKVVSGGTPPVGNSDYYGGSIPWLRTQEVDWKDITDTAIKITDEGLKNSSAKWIPANCVIVAMYGATAAKVAINKIPLTTNQACCNLEIDSDIALYRYVFHWLCKEYLSLKGLGQGSQSNINAQTVKQYKIPIPPLPVQQRIVTVLDNFDAICSDLNIGLPAEIEARKKQYEFYRDQLLTFAVQDEIVLTDRQTDRQTSITR